MSLDEFLEGLIVAIDLPNVKNLDPDLPFSDIVDFDSLATLGVMTFAEIEFDKSIEGEWIWDNRITPLQLLNHLKEK
jgi:acyl carrier protein